MDTVFESDDQTYQHAFYKFEDSAKWNKYHSHDHSNQIPSLPWGQSYDLSENYHSAQNKQQNQCTQIPYRNKENLYHKLPNPITSNHISTKKRTRKFIIRSSDLLNL